MWKNGIACHTQTDLIGAGSEPTIQCLVCVLSDLLKLKMPFLNSFGSKWLKMSPFLLRIVITLVISQTSHSTNYPLQWEYGDYPLPTANRDDIAIMGISYGNSIMYMFGWGSWDPELLKLDTNDASNRTQWQYLPESSPYIGNSHRVTKIRSSIYIWGYGHFYIYDTITDSWLSNSSWLDISPGNQVIAGDNNRYIYMFGGLPYNTYGQFVRRYDTITDTFITLLTTSPHSWFNANPCYYEKYNYIYIFGASGGSRITGVYYYDITNNEWSQQINSVPSQFAGDSNLPIYIPPLDLIYLFDGGKSGLIGDHSASYDPNSNTFRIETDRPFNCSGTTAVGLIQNRIQLFGGRSYIGQAYGPYDTNCRTQELFDSMSPTMAPVITTQFATSTTLPTLVPTPDSISSTRDPSLPSLYDRLNSLSPTPSADPASSWISTAYPSLPTSTTFEPTPHTTSPTSSSTNVVTKISGFGDYTTTQIAVYLSSSDGLDGSILAIVLVLIVVLLMIFGYVIWRLIKNKNVAKEGSGDHNEETQGHIATAHIAPSAPTMDPPPAYSNVEMEGYTLNQGEGGEYYE